MPVKFGLHGLHRGEGIDPAVLRQRAKRAEELGFESIWVGDHIALPVEGNSSSTNPALNPRLEVLSTLSFLSAVTNRVLLAAGVVVLSQRQPVLLAKQLTTIDYLSGGRLIVGVGAGYIEAELAALGVPPNERGARTDEHMSALKALWAEPIPSFDGQFVSFSGVAERPLPIQRPHPPLVIGGHSTGALRRAARFGNGWYGWDLGVEETSRTLERLREAVMKENRPEELGDLEITVTPSTALDVTTARQFAELGVHRLVVAPLTSKDAEIDELISIVGQTLIGRV